MGCQPLCGEPRPAHGGGLFLACNEGGFVNFLHSAMLIAQLSDLHVRPRGQLYKGVADSNRMLAEAIAHLYGLDRRPDLVLLTGDLVDEGRPEEYAAALEIRLQASPFPPW